MAVDKTITGLRELEAQLVKLGAVTGGKVLRATAAQSVTPIVSKMRIMAPVGKKAHKTFKGRLVAPGFLKQSIRKSSRLFRGTAIVKIGVLSEAFYGVQFVDPGTVKSDAQPWFLSTFIRGRQTIESRFASIMRKKILKVANK